MNTRKEPCLVDAAKQNDSLYYMPVFSAWFHRHSDREGLLVLTHSDRLKCDLCEQGFRLKPPPEKWDLNRNKRAVEVLTRLQETKNPNVFRCP